MRLCATRMNLLQKGTRAAENPNQAILTSPHTYLSMQPSFLFCKRPRLQTPNPIPLAMSFSQVVRGLARQASSQLQVPQESVPARLVQSDRDFQRCRPLYELCGHIQESAIRRIVRFQTFEEDVVSPVQRRPSILRNFRMSAPGRALSGFRGPWRISIPRV